MSVNKKRYSLCLCCKNGAQKKAYKSGYPQSPFLLLYKQRKLASFFLPRTPLQYTQNKNDCFFFFFFLCCKHPQRRLTEVSSTPILPREECRLFLQLLVAAHNNLYFFFTTNTAPRRLTRAGTLYFPFVIILPSKPLL